LGSLRLMINKVYRCGPPIGMNVQDHWERIYGTKAPGEVSWYRPHLEVSLKLIERAVPDFSASIIDVGGGESTLVDDLLARGYKNVNVLDVSQTASDVSRKRLGEPQNASSGSSPILRNRVGAPRLRCMAR
jgi:hypothetical protein